MEQENKTYITYSSIKDYLRHYMDDAQSSIDEAYADDSDRYDDNYISYHTGEVDTLWEILSVIATLTPLTVDDIFNSSPLPKTETFDVYEDNGLVTMSLDTLKKLLMNEEFRKDLLPTLVKFEIAMESKKFGYLPHNKEVN